MMPDAAPATPRKPGFIPEFVEPFSGSELDTSRWLPHYLPQWSNRERSAARYFETRLKAVPLPGYNGGACRWEGAGR